MAEPSIITPPAASVTALVFALGAHRFALPAQYVRRIEYPAPLTRVPGGPPWLEGLANLMGEAVAVVDARHWLGLSPAQTRHDSQWLVLAYEGDLIALTIDQRPVLQEVGPEAQRPLPAGDPRQRCASGTLDLHGDTVLLLDLACLMGDAARGDCTVAVQDVANGL